MGNPCYKAPELLMGSTNYSTAIDIWSMECIFAEMLRLELLFIGNDEPPQILAAIFWQFHQNTITIFMISLYLYEINEFNIFICKACLVRQLKKPGLVCLLYATILKHSTLQLCQRYSCSTFDQFFVPLPFINKQYFMQTIGFCRT